MEAMQKRIAEALMKAHGYDREDPQQKSEWSEHTSSAYTMMLEDAQIALDTIMDAPADEFIAEPDPEPLLGVLDPPLTTTSAVEAKGSFFISCQTPPGQPMYVKDVKQWLEILELAEIPDDEEVEGELFLAHDFPLAGVVPN